MLPIVSGMQRKNIFLLLSQKKSHCYFLWLFVFAISFSVSAQTKQDPEFPKGWVCYLSLQQGVVTNFSSSPDYYQAGINIIPQYTIVPAVLRLGARAGVVYQQKFWGGQIGPEASLKLFDVKAGQLGTAANFQLTVAHLWGARHQRLAGAGLRAEIFQIVTIELSSFRDYYHNQWHIQTLLGINLTKPHRESSDPFSNHP